MNLPRRDDPGMHPKVSRPRVPVTRTVAAEGTGDTVYRLDCRHCDYVHHSTVRAALDEQAKYHRYLHTIGAVEVTR